MAEGRGKAYRERLRAEGKRPFAVRILDPRGNVVGVSLLPYRTAQEALEGTMKSRWALSRIARWEGALPADMGPVEAEASPVLDGYCIPEGYRFDVDEADDPGPNPVPLMRMPKFRVVRLGQKRDEAEGEAGQRQG